MKKGSKSMEQIKEIIKKFLTKEVITYGIFGVLTTIVNFITFYIMTNILSLEENLSNAIAIVVAILFAYVTNRNWVFNSNAVTLKEKLNEFGKFILGRAFSMIVELIGFFVMFNILGIQEFVSKIVISVIIIIMNFFISKFFAFKK